MKRLRSSARNLRNASSSTDTNNNNNGQSSSSSSSRAKGQGQEPDGIDVATSGRGGGCVPGGSHDVNWNGTTNEVGSEQQLLPLQACRSGSLTGLNFQAVFSDSNVSGGGRGGAEGADADAPGEEQSLTEPVSSCTDGGSTDGGGGRVGNSVIVSKSRIYPPIWNEFRQTKTLCDVILQSTDGIPFHAHRPLLAAASPYFKKLLMDPAAAANTNTRTTTESSMDHDGDFEPQLQILSLEGIDSKSLSTILEFIYTGKFQHPGIETDLVLLIPITQRLQLFGLLKHCCLWIVTHLTYENAIAMYKLSRTQFCASGQAEIKRYILQHFLQICTASKGCCYKSFEFELLEEFLRDDHLNVNSEECVFITIRDWIEADPSPNRISKLIELLQCVRFGLMSFSYFTSIVYLWKHVQQNQAVQQSLFDASLFLTQLDSRTDGEVDWNDPLARPRIPHQIIFAIGGWSAGSPTNFMETYDARADRWFLTPYSDVNPRAYHGLVTVDNLIYMIGGFDGHEHFNTVRSYNPITKEWADKSCMHFPRCYVSCCVLGRHIYALGGFNGRARMNTVERYSIDQNQWEMMPNMSRQRSDASAASLNGKIYIAGGFNGQEVLSSVEVFDPVEQQWTFLRPMQTPRSGVTLTVHKSHLYAIGGFNGFTRLASGERYNPSIETSDWTPIANMNTARSNFTTAAVDEWLFAIGGFNGNTTIPFCECYDEQTNEWYDICSMNLNRSALNACVINGLPNAQEYSYLSRVNELLGISSPPSTGLPTTASGRPRTRPRHRNPQ